jgi:hypothetical protein
VFNTSNDILENHYGLMRGTHFYPDKPHFVLENGRLVARDLPRDSSPCEAPSGVGVRCLPLGALPPAADVPRRHAGRRT